METGRNFAMSGINSEHHNLPTYEFYTPTHIAITLSVRSHFRNIYLSFYWKKWFYIWYMALAWWLVATTIPQKIKLRICHNAKYSYKPVVSVRFGRLPQSLDYNHILFSVQRKLLSSYDCVGLSNCRIIELSDHRTVGLKSNADLLL
jgi:hypothetical protein